MKGTSQKRDSNGEKDFDGIAKMGEWMIETGICDAQKIEEIKADAKEKVRVAKKNAWNSYQDRVKADQKIILGMLSAYSDDEVLTGMLTELKSFREPVLSEVVSIARRGYQYLKITGQEIPQDLVDYIQAKKEYADDAYHTHLYSQADSSALNIPVVQPQYSDESKTMNGYEIINAFFEIAFDKYPQACAFGEDVGNIGDVNQGLAGLQEKYGVERIFDTGIREWSIVGQAIGMAMRGLKPIAEIQYLDYLIYGLSTNERRPGNTALSIQ